MNVLHLLRWQWEGYSRYHQSRANLLLHVFAVPVFLLSNVAVVAALIARSWLAAAVAIAAMIVSLALQGRGHREELVAPEPFTSPAASCIARHVLKQSVGMKSHMWRHKARKSNCMSGPDNFTVGAY